MLMKRMVMVVRIVINSLCYFLALPEMPLNNSHKDNMRMTTVLKHTPPPENNGNEDEAHESDSDDYWMEDDLDMI